MSTSRCPLVDACRRRPDSGLMWSTSHAGVFFFPLQIRHFLPPDIHELFQRKLRDHALQDMPNFRWCAHVSCSQPIRGQDGVDGLWTFS